MYVQNKEQLIFLVNMLLDDDQQMSETLKAETRATAIQTIENLSNSGNKELMATITIDPKILADEVLKEICKRSSTSGSNRLTSI